MTGELGTDVGTFRSDVASGGIGFDLRTSVTFSFGHVLRTQNNGTGLFDLDFEGHCRIGSLGGVQARQILDVSKSITDDNRSTWAGIRINPTVDGAIPGVVYAPILSGVVCNFNWSADSAGPIGGPIMRGGEFNLNLGGSLATKAISQAVGGLFQVIAGSYAGNISTSRAGHFLITGTPSATVTDAKTIHAEAPAYGTNKWGADIGARVEIDSPAAHAQEVLKLNQLNTGATDGVHIKLNDKAGEATNTVTGDIWRNGNLVKFFDGLVINEGGADADTRIEGATEANLLYIDAGNNRIGVGTATPDTTLTVNGDMNILSGGGLVVGHNAKIDFGAIPEFQVVGTATPDSSMGFARFENNASGPDVRFLKSRGSAIGVNTIVQDGDTLGRFRFQGADTVDFNTTAAQISAEVDGTPAANNIPGRLIFTTRTDGGGLAEKMRITNAGAVGVGLAAPTGKLHVDQASASGAIPVLRLDQGDIDDTFIDFIGTSAADGSRSISSDTTEDSAKFGAIRVEINGVTKWVRVYDNES